MSKISVWTSDGYWSDEVRGCDKVHLMKKAIECEAYKFRDARKKDKDLHDVQECRNKYKDGTVGYSVNHWSGLQIDNKRIDMTWADFLDYYNNLDSVKLKKFIHEQNLLNASFFTMHLSTLQEMAQEETTMTALYERLIELANVPDKGVSRLLFMFEAE